MKQFAGIIAGSILASGTTPSMAEELIASRKIPVGAVISSSDLVAPQSQQALRRATRLIGKEATRTIYEGQPLSDDYFRAAMLVKRNAIVHMQYVKGPMTISTEGRALDEGAFGDRIRVMNLFSKRIVTVIVNGADSVKAKL